MNITCNGSPHTLNVATLAQALQALGFNGQSVATAVNGAFVAINDRATHPLQTGDALEVLAPMQGG